MSDRDRVSDPIAAVMPFGEGRVAYWVVEPPSGASADAAPVLLLHGLAADHRGLLPLAASLPGTPVVAVDLPGFGRSDPLAGPHRLEKYAEVVEALCAHLGLSRVLVVGHSLGASIALTHAALYPGRVGSLAMLMPVTTGAGPLTWVPRAYYLLGSRLPARAARAWFLSRVAVFVSDKSTLMTRDPSVRRRILRDDYRTAALASPRAVQEIYRNIRQTPFLDLAGKVRTNSIILGAQHDALAPARVLTRLHDHVRGSKLVMVPSAGHLWPVEQPGAAAEVIVAALRRAG